MSQKEYKLCANLYGHSLDVRSVTVTANNDIVSGSRDKTAKFWKYDDLRRSHSDVMTYKDQKNFVISVLYLEPSSEFVDGLIVTGGNDNQILVYKPSEPFATFKLKEHTNAVSCLSKADVNNAFLSGSWDSTAKYWQVKESPQCLITFTGHSAAVWSVIQIGDGRFVTASADKSIIIWTSSGQKLQTLTGHTDCVRSLVDFPDLNIFLSASNDASIKAWSYTGENLNTYYGHTNYIYSVARCKSGGENAFVSSDEDRTVRYWENGENVSTFTLPAQSVWSVACLQNGDIVTGSSDGVVRIFTTDDSRVADEQTLTKFNEEVNALKQQSVQEIGGVKVSDLPDKEALYDRGKRAGQMKMIRESHGVVAYTWVEDGDKSHWEKVGDVMGGTDKDSTGKTTFEGKAYDFVFSVDVEDGKPPLKLPYNKGDDVYQTAHAFLTKNFLPAEYLEQVVDFILKNSKDQFVPPSNAGYQDPFTGGNRYTPSYSNGATVTGPNVDPFTGSDSYSTVSNKSSTAPSGGGNYFPVASYRTFDVGDPNVILNKLKEFNKKSGDGNDAVEDRELEELVKLCVGPPSDPNSFDVLFKLLDWPDDIIFPTLDVVRMAVRNAKNNEIIAGVNNGIVMEKLKNYINENCAVLNNTVVALRTICNLCTHEPGETLVYNSRFDIMENITSLTVTNKNGQIALATVLLNLTLLSIKKEDDLGYSILAQVLPDILTKFTDPEAHFRGYVAVGTLLTLSGEHKNDAKARMNENAEFLKTLQLHGMFGASNDLETKRMNCVKQLQNII